MRTPTPGVRSCNDTFRAGAKEKATFPIRELVKRSGLSKQAIHFYLREELLPGR